MLTDAVDNSRLDTKRQGLSPVDRVAGGVAHEFNNVLQIVRGYVTFSRAALPETDATRKDLDEAVIAIDRAADLARWLLQLTRADHPGSTAANLSMVLGELHALQRVILGDSISATIAVPDEPLFVAAGDGLLRRALTTLCLDASAAMPYGGRLDLFAESVEVRAGRELTSGYLPSGAYAAVRVDGVADATVYQSNSVLDGQSASGPSEGNEPLLAINAFAKQCGGGVDVVLDDDIARTVLFLPLVNEPGSWSNGSGLGGAAAAENRLGSQG